MPAPVQPKQAEKTPAHEHHHSHSEKKEKVVEPVVEIKTPEELIQEVKMENRYPSPQSQGVWSITDYN